MRARLTRRRPSGPMVISLLALFVALGGSSYAVTGDTFILGQPNDATDETSLTAVVDGGKALELSNTSAAAGSTALGLTVTSGKPPFTVNSAAKVVNLNADRLDTLDSTAFL